MRQAAIDAARAVNYVSAGTVEVYCRTRRYGIFHGNEYPSTSRAPCH